MQAVLLPVGSDLYAVPMTWMREVLAAPIVTDLVTGPPVIIGLINLRGEIVPLLDTSVLLGVGSLPTSSFVAVLHTAYGPVGLGASAIPERVVIDSEVAPSGLFGAAGIYRVERGVAVLLDPEALLTPENIAHPGGRVLQTSTGST